MALTLAINRPLDAVCTFYGGGMQELFGQIGKIKCPVLGLYGDQDVSIPLGTVQQFQELLTRYGVEHEIKVYPNSGFGRLRDVVQGPDGLLYILTSNRDGRGSPTPNDDRIIRLRPA
jgi:dienelactone hydrolase